MSWSSSCFSLFSLFRRRLCSLGTEEAADCSATAGPVGVLQATGDFRADFRSDLKDMVKIELKSVLWRRKPSG